MPSNGTTRDGTDDTNDITRRRALRSLAVAGGAGLTAALAGCGEVTSDVTSRTYEAEPVGLDEEGMELGHRLADEGTWEVTRSPETVPLDAEVTLINKFAVYSHQSSHLGFVAMPAVEENGESLNPLVDRPLAEVVDSELARSLLGKLGLARYADVDWQGGPGDDELVPMLGGEAELAAFRSGEGADERRLRIARIRHEGDVVFGVGAATLPGSTAATPTPDDAGSNDDGTGGTSPGAWWTNWRERWRRGLNRGRRTVPSCYQSSTLQFVEIDEPGDGTFVDTEGVTDANVQVRLPNFGTVEFDAKATSVGYCIDRLQWSYRLDPQNHSNSACNYTTSWTTLGTGRQQTFRWTICNEQSLSFEIRVEALDSSGSVLFSDTHAVEFVAVQ
jgi:hypothetical protein